MEEVGIDISPQQSKSLEAIPLREIGRLITLCGDAAEICATLPGTFIRSHWPLADPTAATGTDAELLPRFREVRDLIKEQVANLLAHP